MVANKLKEFFKKNSMTQTYLAELLNMEIRKIQGKFTRDSFTDTDLIKIAEIMGYKLAFVRDGEAFILE